MLLEKAKMRQAGAVIGTEGVTRAETADAAEVRRRKDTGTAVMGGAAGSAARIEMLTENGGIKTASQGMQTCCMTGFHLLFGFLHLLSSCHGSLLCRKEFDRDKALL